MKPLFDADRLAALSSTVNRRDRTNGAGAKCGRPEPGGASVREAVSFLTALSKASDRPQGPSRQFYRIAQVIL
jgi:hypothetical protein